MTTKHLSPPYEQSVDIKMYLLLMEKSHRKLLKAPKRKEWALRHNVIICTKCKKLNPIVYEKVLFIECGYCGQPNKNIL